MIPEVIFVDQERFDNMIKVIDESYDLIQEYDSKPRQFGKVMLYPVETHTLAIIRNHPGINASMIAKELKKTLSASSQILKKLEQKGLISRTKNPHNNREYNLYLTVGGRQIFDLHGQFDKKIMKRYFKNLISFSNEEIDIYIKVQRALNKEYAQDNEESL